MVRQAVVQDRIGLLQEMNPSLNNTPSSGGNMTVCESVHVAAVEDKR